MLVVFAGDVDAPLNPRLEPMVDALRAAGLVVEPVPFHPGHAAALDSRLAGVGRGDGVLVWADPLADDGNRADLDRALRHAEHVGAWVSTRPDVIDRIGTKAVLVDTRDLGWGSDSHLYRELGELRRDFPGRLAAARVRVLKAARGNGGRTVWKVGLVDVSSTVPLGRGSEVVVQHARLRDGTATRMTLGELFDLVEDATRTLDAWGGVPGRLVDQEFVPGITRGIVRCYLVGGGVVGFARQYPEGVRPDGPLDVVPDSMPAPSEVMGLPSPKTMYPPDEPALALLRERLENEWVPGMTHLLGLRPEDLPALWDVDLLIADTASGRAGAGGGIAFVLCEVNASSVIPFPPEAPARVTQYVVDALVRHRPTD